MRFKGIGKKIGDMAYKLTASGYHCGGECVKCRVCQNPHPSTSHGERQNRERGNLGKDAQIQG